MKDNYPENESEMSTYKAVKDIESVLESGSITVTPEAGTSAVEDVAAAPTTGKVVAVGAYDGADMQRLTLTGDALKTDMSTVAGTVQVLGNGEGSMSLRVAVANDQPQLTDLVASTRTDGQMGTPPRHITVGGYSSTDGKSQHVDMVDNCICVNVEAFGDEQLVYGNGPAIDGAYRIVVADDQPQLVEISDNTRVVDAVGLRFPTETDRVPWLMKGQTNSLGTSYQSISNLATDVWFQQLTVSGNVTWYAGITDKLNDGTGSTGATQVEVLMVDNLGIQTTSFPLLPPSGGGGGWSSTTILGTHQQCLGVRIWNAGGALTNIGDVYIFHTASPAVVPPQNTIGAAIEARAGVGWGSSGAVPDGDTLYLTRLRGYANTVVTIQIIVNEWNLISGPAGALHDPHYEFVVSGPFDIALHDTFTSKSLLFMRAKSDIDPGSIHMTLEGYLV